MAFISLDKNNFYHPPQLQPARRRKPSKSPVPPEWTSSFLSQMPSTADSLSSLADASVLQPSAPKASNSSTEESLQIISSVDVVEQTGGNVVPCQPVVPIPTSGRRSDDEGPCDKDTEEWNRPRHDIDCLSQRIWTSTEVNPGNLDMMNISPPSHLSTSQEDIELLDELPDVVSNSSGPINEERMSTIPESPILNTPFNDDDQPINPVDPSIIPIDQDSHVDAAAPETQNFDVTHAVEDADLDSALQGSRAGQRFATVEPVCSVLQQADSTSKTQKTRESRQSQSRPQNPIHSETAVVSLRGARHRKRSRRRPAPIRRPTSPDSGDDSGDDDYYDFSDEDAESNNQSQAQPSKRMKMAKACPSQGREERNAREATLPSSSHELSLEQNTSHMEQVRMHGRLFRKVTLSQVQYFFYIAENPSSTVFTPEPTAFNIEQEYAQDAGNKMSSLQVMNIEGIFTRDIDSRGDTWSWCFKERKASSSPGSESRDAVHPTSSDTHCSRSSNLHRPGKRPPYSIKEEKLLIDLKRKQNLPWREIAKRFPGRKINALQAHYYTKLKDRQEDTSQLSHDQGVENCIVSRSLQPAVVNTRCERYSLRSNRH